MTPVAFSSRQKLGLALSGGGFRASFFHLGVLALLADRGLLRHVEVISTVSGGSIVGALYYLKLKRLLETKEDSEITDRDYQRLVEEVQAAFRAAVQKNLRLLTFVNPLKNLKMSRPDYSRSDRLAELLDVHLYRPAIGSRGPVLMRELVIAPRGEGPSFHPERENGRRAAKVPILLINATSLNTGRNWRFEAVRMGEPPRENPVYLDVDKRMRLARTAGYEALPPRYREITLGHAVAASAAVPGLFHPLAISRLYPGVRVELVDGGVHDNQGIQGLIDRGCTQFVVSDGSSQMEGEKRPSTSVLSTLLRSNSVLLSRIREEQVVRLETQATSRAFCFVHMKKGIAPEVIPTLPSDGVRRGAGAGTSDAGTSRAVSTGRAWGLRRRMDPRVQEALAHIRTDLDTFHDAEAYSLMMCGYLIASSELPKSTGIWLRRSTVSPLEWPFFSVAPLMAKPTADYVKLLRVSASVVLKVFSLYPLLWAGVAAALCAMAAAVLRTPGFFLEPVIPPDAVPSRLGVLILLVAAGLWASGAVRRIAAGHPQRRRRGPTRWLLAFAEWTARLLLRGLPAAVASIFIYLYLILLNPLYLRAGNVDRLLGERRKFAPSVEGWKGIPRQPPA